MPGACVTALVMTLVVTLLTAALGAPDGEWGLLAALSVYYLLAGGVGLWIARLVERRWGPLPLGAALRVGIACWLLGVPAVGPPLLAAWLALR